MYGTLRAAGVAPTFVWCTPLGAVENFVAGAPFTPEKTMFQLEPLELPKVLFWLYHCCWDADSTEP